MTVCREFPAQSLLKLLKSHRHSKKRIFEGRSGSAGDVCSRAKRSAAWSSSRWNSQPRQRIQGLNRRFRGVDRNTDVIAFRYGEKYLWEGDIAINVAQARIQAKKMRHPTRREIRVLWIHGILHLLGYTDYEPRPRRRMFKRQNQLLRAGKPKPNGRRALFGNERMTLAGSCLFSASRSPRFSPLRKRRWCRCPVRGLKN